MSGVALTSHLMTDISTYFQVTFCTKKQHCLCTALDKPHTHMRRLQGCTFAVPPENRDSLERLRVPELIGELHDLLHSH
jgi:hypothetical protein